MATHRARLPLAALLALAPSASLHAALADPPHEDIHFLAGDPLPAGDFDGRLTGPGYDLGSVLAYPGFEAATHQGLDRAYLIQIGWHPHHRHG